MRKSVKGNHLYEAGRVIVSGSPIVKEKDMMELLFFRTLLCQLANLV